MRLRFLVFALALALSAGPLQATERYGEREPVRLTISNGAASGIVRCQIVLAHFVTLADHRLAPGESRVFSVLRDESSGALVVPRDDGRLMAIENVYCGLDERWDETRAGFRLSPLQDGKRNRVDVVCGGGGTPVCRMSGDAR